MSYCKKGKEKKENTSVQKYLRALTNCWMYIILHPLQILATEMESISKTLKQSWKLLIISLPLSSDLMQYLAQKVLQKSPI